jgi:hypothetical protein
MTTPVGHFFLKTFFWLNFSLGCISAGSRVDKLVAFLDDTKIFKWL